MLPRVSGKQLKRSEQSLHTDGHDNSWANNVKNTDITEFRVITASRKIVILYQIHIIQRTNQQS